MDRLETIRWLWTFHAWARSHVVDAASGLAPDQLGQAESIPGGLATGSIHDMLGHIVGAEEIWQRRWEGNAEATLPSGRDFRDLGELAARLRTVESERTDLLGRLTEQSLEEGVTYLSVTRHARETYPLWATMLHLSNHTTHHRAEALAALSAFGQPAESVDLVDFLRATASTR